MQHPFTVKDIEEVLGRLQAHGATLHGELTQYESKYRLCYVRGPKAIMIALAEKINGKPAVPHPPRCAIITEWRMASVGETQYSAMVLGATGNVGGRIVQLLIKNPLCKMVVVISRRKTETIADTKAFEVVVNMDRLEEEVASHAHGVDVALAAFSVGKDSAKMPEEEVRKIEVAYPQAFCRAARAGGARVCGVMTAVGADPKSGVKYARIIGEKEKAVESVKFDFLGLYGPGVILGNSNTPSVLATSCHSCTGPCRHKYHSIRKNDLARAMVAQSEQAFLTIAQGNPPKVTVKILG